MVEITAPQTVKWMVGRDGKWEGFRVQTALAGEQEAGDADVSEDKQGAVFNFKGKE